MYYIIIILYTIIQKFPVCDLGRPVPLGSCHDLLYVKIAHALVHTLVLY